jgi:hypothetical protein
VSGALTLARLRRRVGVDDAIGGSLTLIALVLIAFIGVHEARRPIYGPIDEFTHTAYVLAVAKDGIPPFYGRDRAFIRPGALAKRDVLVPPPDSVGSAPLPIGVDGDLQQQEAFQPPLYYYAAAPVTWFVSGRDKVVAIRIFDVFLYLCAALLAFLALRDIGGSPLAGGIAALMFANLGGVLGILSFVTNGAITLPFSTAALWLAARGIRDRSLSWPLAAVTAGLAITQIIMLPLAALCVLAPAVAELRVRGRGAVRPIARRIAVAAAPLALWVLSSLYRYHWPIPRTSTGGATALTSASTRALDVQQFTSSYFLSFVSSIQEAFHWWESSPYMYDWRPLALTLFVIPAGLGLALFRGSARHRQAVGLWLVAGYASHATVFLMLYLAVILTGGGDFVFRYFAAEQAAFACLAALCLVTLFERPALQRGLTLVVGIALAYWSFNASPL